MYAYRHTICRVYLYENNKKLLSLHTERLIYALNANSISDVVPLLSSTEPNMYQAVVFAVKQAVNVIFESVKQIKLSKENMFTMQVEAGQCSELSFRVMFLLTLEKQKR